MAVKRRAVYEKSNIECTACFVHGDMYGTGNRFASDDDSVMDMKVTELIQGDRTNALYPYWVHTNGTKKSTVLKVLNSLGKTLQVVPRK